MYFDSHICASCQQVHTSYAILHHTGHHGVWYGPATTNDGGVLEPATTATSAAATSSAAATDAAHADDAITTAATGVSAGNEGEKNGVWDH